MRTRYVVLRYSHSIRLSSTKRHEDKLCCLQVFSCDLITFDKEKRGQAMLSSGILIWFDYLRQRETRTSYVVIRYSHSIRLPSTKRNEDKLCCLQVFSYDSITFDKEKRAQAMLSSGILIRFDYLRQRETRKSYVVLKYSHSIRLPSTKRNKDKLCCLPVFSFDSITFDKEKPGQAMLASGILIRFDYLRQRETRTSYVVFRYSHSIRLPSAKRNKDRLCCFQVFSLLFESTFGKEKRRCVMVSSGILDT